MQCPGQDSRYWDGEAIFESHCPKCGNVVEFFKDDSKRRCKQCGHELMNPRIDFGCASYCPFAEQCLGGLSPEMLAQKQDLLTDRVAIEMKKRHGDDFARIGRATRAARLAAKLAKAEEANKAAVTIAALLAEVDGPVADAPGTVKDTTQARAMLTELKANEGLVNEVCALIGGLPDSSKVSLATVNARVLHDAWQLALIPQKIATSAALEEAETLVSSLATVNGRHEGEAILAAARTDAAM